MTQTHIKLVSEEDLQNIPWIHYDTSADGIVNITAFLAWFNSLASAPEVGEAVADKVERNYVYEDGIEPGYDKEPAVILALRNTELQKRVEQLEDLLSSAYNIANRNGEDTHWFRFAAQLHVHGISPVTAKTFKILPSDEGYQPDRTAQLEEIYGYVYQVNDTYTMFSYKKPPEDAYDEGTLVAVSRAHYSTEKKLQVKLAERDEEIERLQSYEQGLNAVIAWMKERGLYHDADYFGEGADFSAILTEHEQQVSACTEREIKKDNKRLVEEISNLKR